MVWEACVTRNNNWGYCYSDHAYKPASLLIKKLVECVSKGGNMILNVGPDGEGSFPRESLDILQQIGKWMKVNSESIYNCGIAEVEKPEYGRATQNGNLLYFHLFENTLGPVPLMGLRKEQIQNMQFLASGRSIPMSTSWVQIVFADLGLDPVLPDPVDTVQRVELKG